MLLTFFYRTATNVTNEGTRQKNHRQIASSEFYNYLFVSSVGACRIESHLYEQRDIYDSDSPAIMDGITSTPPLHILAQNSTLLLQTTPPTAVAI